MFNESNADKVVINGDNVGAYGLDIGESFGSLIQELPLVENGYSALIDSLHPKWLLKYYDSILDAAQKNTLGMIVSAIQSGSERIIKLMRRKADMNQLKKAFLELKKVSPQLILGTEVIIGFPTETDTELEESIKFVLDTKIDWGHLFIFSPKDGTEAAAMEEQVDENIKIKRINHFIEQLKANDYLVHKEEKSQAVIFCRKEVCMKSREADNVFWKHCFDTICPNEQGQGMERKIKSTGENKESVLKQAFDEWRKDLPQYSEEPFCREIRMERKEASDVLWNGGELKRTFSEEMQSIQMERESVVKEKERLTEEKTEPLLSELEQETVKTIDIGRELHNICLELKREAREKGYEEWMRERLKEILENTEFTPVNREIKKRVFRKEVISQTAYQKYRIFQPQIKHTLMKMKQDLLPVLKRKKTHILRYQYIGKRLDMAHLWNPEKRIFQTKIPSQNMDTAIGFLLDQSGSIDSKRWETSVLTALCVVEFAQVFGIPVCVNGHCTGREHIGRKREEIVCLHSYLEFGEKEEGKYRILDMETGGANRDGAALLYMAEKMVKRKEKMKILIFFCDGLPNAQGYGGKVAREDLQKVQRQLKQKQITLFVAAIGRDQEDIQNIYGNACINAENLEQLPHQIVKKLLEYMG